MLEKINWDEVPTEQVAPGMQRQIIAGAKLMIAKMRFEDGFHVPLHSHDNEQITEVISGTIRFWFGDNREQQMDLHAGETAYRALIADHPRHAVAYNNLAEILSARGCHAQARRAADRALEIAAVDSPALVAAIRETRDGIPPGPDTAECTPRMDAAGP